MAKREGLSERERLRELADDFTSRDSAHDLIADALAPYREALLEGARLLECIGGDDVVAWNRNRDAHLAAVERLTEGE